ncbi:MAG: DUF542 domain-containing protein [Thermoanaerobaculia bacterium]
MKVDQTLPIATIAADIPGARSVFESLGIDYACGGARSLADAAHEEGVDPELLVASLRRLAPAGKTDSWNERPLTDLIHHLTNEHHRFIREEMAVIALRMFDLCAPPARPAADLQSLRTALARLSDILIPHMHQEEDNVFRAIELLEAEWQSNEPPLDGELRTRIGHVVCDHGTIAAQLRTIRGLRLTLEESNELQPRCRTILDSVARLEAHLHEYMFLENCILFPRAVALQQQMTAA